MEKDAHIMFTVVIWVGNYWVINQVLLIANVNSYKLLVGLVFIGLHTWQAMTQNLTLSVYHVQ